MANSDPVLIDDRAHRDDMRDPGIAGMSRGAGQWETASRQAEAKKYTDELVGLYGRFLGIAEGAFTRYAAADQRGMADVEEAVRGALEQTITAEAKSLVGKMPYGKVILITLELSNAFAAGVGEGIAVAHAKARAGSSRPRTPEEEALYERKYLARATAELDDVMLGGMAKLSDKVVNMLFETASTTLKKSVSDVMGQIAKSLPRHYDLFAILNADVKEKSASIPHGRAGVERITFGFASALFVQQYASEASAKRLTPIVGALKAKEPLDVALAGGVLQVLFDGSYAQYRRYVHVDRAVEVLRDELKEAARGLLRRARESGASIEVGPSVGTDGSVIRIPQALQDQLTSPQGEVSAATYQRLLARESEYEAIRLRIVKEIADIGQSYQRQIRRMDPEVQSAEANRLYNQLVDLRNAGLRTLLTIERRIVQEFGAAPEGYGDVHTRLTVGKPTPQDLIPISQLEPSN